MELEEGLERKTRSPLKQRKDVVDSSGGRIRKRESRFGSGVNGNASALKTGRGFC